MVMKKLSKYSKSQVTTYKSQVKTNMHPEHFTRLSIPHLATQSVTPWHSLHTAGLSQWVELRVWCLAQRHFSIWQEDLGMK